MQERRTQSERCHKAALESSPRCWVSVLQSFRSNFTVCIAYGATLHSTNKREHVENKGVGASEDRNHNRINRAEGLSAEENQASGGKQATGEGIIYCGYVKQKARHLYLAELMEHTWRPAY